MGKKERSLEDAVRLNQERVELEKVHREYQERKPRRLDEERKD